MRKLLILGAGGHGEVVGEIAFLMKKWDVISFLDDDTNKDKCLSFEVIGKIKQLESFIHEYDDVFVAIGNNDIRKKLIEKVESHKQSIPTLIHPSAVISTFSSVDYGSVVMANVIVNPNCQIGKGCIINTASTIDHDCIIKDYVHISPGCHVSGEVYIDEEVWIGTGSSIKNGIHIQKNSICGVGSIIVNNISENVIVMGNPASEKGSRI